MNAFNKIKQIAEINPYGFTISLLDFSTPKSGYIVAMQLTQNHFGDDGLKKVIEVAEKSTFCVGGQFDEKQKQFYYDCVMIVQDLETALQLGKANKQIAIYHIDTQSEIRL